MRLTCLAGERVFAVRIAVKLRHASNLARNAGRDRALAAGRCDLAVRSVAPSPTATLRAIPENPRRGLDTDTSTSRRHRRGQDRQPAQPMAYGAATERAPPARRPE